MNITNKITPLLWKRFFYMLKAKPYKVIIPCLSLRRNPSIILAHQLEKFEFRFLRNDKVDGIIL